MCNFIQNTHKINYFAILIIDYCCVAIIIREERKKKKIIVYLFILYTSSHIECNLRHHILELSACNRQKKACVRLLLLAVYTYERVEGTFTRQISIQKEQ